MLRNHGAGLTFLYLKRTTLQQVDRVFPALRDIDRELRIHRICIFILDAAKANNFTNWGGCLGAGIFGGLGMMASAWYQGKSAAVACDALGETGKGMVNYLMVLGIVETVALFVLVFSMMVL